MKFWQINDGSGQLLIFSKNLSSSET